MAADTNGGYHRTDPNAVNSSPPTSPPHLHCRHKSQQLHFKHQQRHRVRSLSFASASRRHLLRYFLLLLLVLYFSGLITCVGPLFAILRGPLPPGSIYRSHEVFEKLWPHIQSDNSSSATAMELSSIWRYRKLRELKSCQSTKNPQGIVFSMPDRYLMVEANGGLNQQRSSICNAVAVAGLLNATLVIPKFEFHSVWKDSSVFADIYDEDHFISTLKDFITVVRELPDELMRTYDFNISNIPTFRVHAWASAEYYLEGVYPVLRDHRAIRLSPFANRLAVSIPAHIQFLRCLANYKALRFSSPISMLAYDLVKRMRKKSSISSGKYVSVHLRFEEDMVAFSCCVYDGGKSEKSEMDAIREKGWGKKFKSRDRVIEPGLNRVNGRCPMTPLEVGMMLRGMGFSNNTPIFLASGKIYRPERNLAPLRKMFPLLYTKDSLATAEELAEYENYSSRLAALDYIVCLYSEVFVTTQGGNFPHFLMGHRRFLYNGHSKTIKPDKRKLVLLLQNETISWDAFKKEMKSMLSDSDRKGTLVPQVKKSRRKDSIYSNPIPECRCLLDSKISSSNDFLLKINS